MQAEIPSLRKYWPEAVLVLSILAILLYAGLAQQFTISGTDFTYPSLASYALCFVLAYFFLHRQHVELFDRTMLALAAMASGIVLFEIVYHYGFGVVSLHDFLYYDLTFLGNESSGKYFSLDWYLIILLLPFVGRRYMSFNKWVVAVIAFSSIVMFFWIAAGYPQFLDPQVWPDYANPPLHLISSSIDTDAIVFYGKLFNGLAKVISIIPALLFYKKKMMIESQS